jgi:quercetin dioxygenase-like cupin family protein
MKIINHSQCQEMPLPVEGAKDAFIKSLIAQHDGAQNFVMFAIRVLPGGCTPLHEHAWEEENFVLRGSGEAMAGADGESRPVRAGDVIFTPAGHRHDCRNTGDEDLEILCLVPNTGKLPPQQKSGHPDKLVPFDRIPEQPVEDKDVKGVLIRILVGPDDGAPNFVMRRFRVIRGGHTPHHAHPWEHEVFILRGRGEIDTPEGPKPLAPGDAVFVPPDALHRFRNPGPDDLEFLCVIPHPTG